MWKAHSIYNWISQIQLIEHGLRHYSWFLRHSFEISQHKRKKEQNGSVISGCVFSINLVDVITMVMIVIVMSTIWDASRFPSFTSFQITIFEFRHQSRYRIKRLRILPVQSGLWHSLLSAQWPRHSDPPWAAAEHCLVLCWVPLAQVTEQSLQELHSCHCPSTEAPTTTQQESPMWREEDGRQKWEDIFRSLFSLRVKANKTDIKFKAEGN